MNTQSTPADGIANAQAVNLTDNRVVMVGNTACMQNEKGSFIPLANIQQIERASDALVMELIGHAKAAHDMIASFKTKAFSDIGAFVDLSLEEYGAKTGGKKGNITLYSFDGRYRVQFAVADRIAFDYRLQAAKALIDECILSWSDGSNANILELVQNAFQTDKNDNVSPSRILPLLKRSIKDERWQRAMKAIGESIQVVGSKQYIRFYERRGDTGQYNAISLDIASI